MVFVRIFIFVFVFILFRTAQEGSKNMQKGIIYLSRIMQDFADGKIHSNIIVNSRDEIGKISIYIQEFAISLVDSVKTITVMTNGVLEFSNKFLDHSKTMIVNNAEQFEFLQGVSASLEQLSAATDNIASSAKFSAEQAQKAREKLGLLQNEISEISKVGMEASTKARETSHFAESDQQILSEAIQKIQELNQSTTKISEAVGVIRDVADQVNLLSLNASIESARAGEFGRGFAVVASEISKLAEKTLGNSKDIIKSSKEAIHKSSEGETYIQNTGKNFTEILNRVQETNSIVKHIAIQSKAQIKLSEDVNNTFQTSLKMSQEISNATEEQKITNQNVVQSINQMNQLMENINLAGNSLQEISVDLELKIKSLASKISFFKVSE
jgi:methyl-accepting chemotaxis protein